jgi:hypothetical protein
VVVRIFAIQSRLNLQKRKNDCHSSWHQVLETALSYLSSKFPTCSTRSSMYLLHILVGLFVDKSVNSAIGTSWNALLGQEAIDL